MINALEKVVYPNGKTQSLAEIGGAVEGLSALIDEVDRNTSAIGSITSQLSALVSDVNTNTSAIASINQQLGQLVGDWTLLATDTQSKNLEYISDIVIPIANLLSAIEHKEVLFNYVCKKDDASGRVDFAFQDIIDGDILRANILLSDTQNDLSVPAGSSCYSPGPHTIVDNKEFMYGAFFSYMRDAQGNTYFRVQHKIYNLTGNYNCTFSIYVKDKPTPPTRTVKKKAVVKKKGETT